MKRTTDRSPLFIILAAVSIALLILSSSGRLAPVEGFFMRVSKPFLLVFNGLGRQVTNVITTVQDLATLRAQNQQLTAQANTLTIDNLRLKEVETENERLRELLQFRQVNPTFDFRGGQVIARVLNSAASNYLSSISIDLGSQHGIKSGMPVVTERGLVGRVDKVGPSSSTVLLITDPSSGVQALVQRTTSRSAGVVKGEAGSYPVMEYIPQDADVSEGDSIITSGFGGTFPKNLIIGQVVEVQHRDYEMFQRAIVRPTVDFDRLEFVLVITNFNSQPDSVG